MDEGDPGGAVESCQPALCSGSALTLWGFCLPLALSCHR